MYLVDELLKMAAFLNERIEDKARLPEKVSGLESLFNNSKKQFECVMNKILVFSEKQIQNNKSSIGSLRDHTPSDKFEKPLIQYEKSDSMTIEELSFVINDPSIMRAALDVLASPLCDIRLVDFKEYSEISNQLKSHHIISSGSREFAQPRLRATLLYDIERSTSSTRCIIFFLIALVICGATCFVCLYFLN